MKSFLIGVGVFVVAIVVIAAIFGLSWMATYNDLNAKQQNAESLWGNVQSVLQRRADLIPNYVATVERYAKHEADVFKSVAEARQGLGGKIEVNANNAEELQALAAQQQQITSALSRLLAVVENYPELKANQNFMAMQDELAGSENRINTARIDYNDAGVKPFNTRVGSAFGGFVARFHGFEKKPYFEASPESQSAPKVEFSN